MICSRLLLMLTSFLCIKVDATILRLPCTTVADFNIFRVGRRLTDHVLRTDYGLTDEKCMMKCVEHHKCRSYNINTKAMHCELNSKAHADNGTKIVDDPDWVYKSTDFEANLVGIVCKELNPCQEGILCRDTCSHPYYECIHCDETHTGLHCNKPIDKDECAKNPCQNSGSCIDLFASYECSCKPGYTGRNCENEIDECSSLPCFNGAECINGIASFQCKCLRGFTGINCETDINECSSNPCPVGNLCTDQIGKFLCLSTNLAYGKVTSQSSTYMDAVSSRVVDGNKSGVYQHMSCSHTLLDSKPWWQVDVGEQFLIYAVNVTNREDCCQERLSNFKIFVDNSLCKHFTGSAGKGDTKVTCDSPVKGNIVKIELMGTGYLTLCEVTVIGVKI